MIWVVDASVAIKWFVAENLFETAEQLLVSETLLCAPDFIAIEVSGVAWKKAIRGDLSHEQVLAIADELRGGSVVLNTSVDLVERALQIALSLNHSIYDCLYLACAEDVGGVLVTADRRFCSKVQNTDFSGLICYLEDAIEMRG